jgi:hypothetical protein
MMERTWNNMLYSLQKEGLRQHFTPQEMQLALADLQVHFTYAVMDYAMYHEDAVRKYELRDDRYQMVILDSLEWNEIYKAESYKALHRVDFDNPLLLTSDSYPITLNRIQYARPVSRQKYKGTRYKGQSLFFILLYLIKSISRYLGRVHTSSSTFASSLSI